MKFNTIEEAIADIKDGKVVIVIDDENRENEGDFVAAAEKVTPEMINFMATHGKGSYLYSPFRKKMRRVRIRLNDRKKYCCL